MITSSVFLIIRSQYAVWDSFRTLSLQEEMGDKSVDSSGSDINLARGDIFYLRSDFQNAENEYNSAVAYFSSIGDERKLARALVGLASVYTALFRHSRAIEHAERAISLNSANIVKAEAKLRIGTCYRRMEQFSEAFDILHESQSIAKLEKDQVLESEINIAIGDVFWKQGNLEEAEKYYRITIQLALPILKIDPNNPKALFNVSQAKYAIGRGYLDREKYEDAEKLLSDSFRDLNSLGNFFGIEYCAQQLGRLYENLDNTRDAGNWYNESYVATFITKNDLRRIETLFHIANLAYLKKEFRRANEFAIKTVEDAKSNSNEEYFRQMARLLALSGNIDIEQSFTDKAIAYYKDAILYSVRAGPSSKEEIFSLISQKLLEIAKTRRDLSLHIIESLIIWWPEAKIDGEDAIKVETDLEPKLDKLTKKYGRVSLYLQDLLDHIIS
jgi:tetratricopeptide (TPR) repeat protein